MSASTDQIKNQTLKETIQIKICDIDTPQFVCEDILAYNSQQYDVKVISSRALCYVITKKQFQLKFPKESIENIKQLFEFKFQRRQDVVNQQILKYKDRFKIEERQESLSQSNQQFKIKFKKQYLNKIYAQSVLKVNTEQSSTKKDDIFQQNEDYNDDEQNDYKKRNQDSRQFNSQKNQTKFQHNDYIMPDEQSQHKEYNKGIDEMKNNFSDYILDCVKKEVNSNFLLTFKQRDSISNARNSITRMRSSTDIQSFHKLSVIDEGEVDNISKRGSIFSSRLINKSRISVSSLPHSLSQSPTLILRLSQEEPKCPSSTNFLNVHYFKTNGSSNRKESIEIPSNRKSTLLSSIEVIHERRKSNTLCFPTKRKSNGSSQSRRTSQGDVQNSAQEQNNQEESITITKEDNQNIEKEPKSSSNPSISQLSSNSSKCIPVIIEPQKLNQKNNQIESNSMFKSKKVIDFENLKQLPYVNPISEKFIAMKSGNSQSVSPTRQKNTSNYNQTQDSLIDKETKEYKEVNDANEAKDFKGTKDFKELKVAKEIKEITQSKVSDQEKSLLIEGTWDLGLGNEKQRESDLKKELISRGLLKMELQRPQIKNIFPALDKYKRSKIEQKIQKIKLQQDKINNQGANNMQVSVIKENTSSIFSSNRSIKLSQVNQTFSSNRSIKLTSSLVNQNNNNNEDNNINNAKPLQQQDIELLQKQNPFAKIDQSNSSVLNKQYSLPLLSAKTIAVNPVDPPLFLPRIAQNNNPLSQVIPINKSQHLSILKSQGSYSPSTKLFKNLNQVSSYSQTPQHRSCNYSMYFATGDVQNDLDNFKGFKYTSPITQKLNAIIQSPQSSFKKQGEIIFDFSLGENNNSLQQSNTSEIIRVSHKSVHESIKQSPNETSTQIDQLNGDNMTTSQTYSKKKDISYQRPKQFTEQGQSMLQRINHQRPIIFQNVLQRDQNQQNNNVK